MAEHSIEELKRQRDIARMMLEAAKSDLDEAEQRLHEALAQETGWIGKLATREGRSILVQDITFLMDKPFKVTGFKLNRDGRPGRVLVSFIIDGEPIEFTDYTAPPENGK